MTHDFKQTLEDIHWCSHDIPDEIFSSIEKSLEICSKIQSGELFVVNNTDLDALANNLLSLKLPVCFDPCKGISYDRALNSSPTMENLFSKRQAKQILSQLFKNIMIMN